MKGATASIAPMLSVRRGAEAVAFYKKAFGAEERFKIEGGGGVVDPVGHHWEIGKPLGPGVGE